MIHTTTGNPKFRQLKHALKLSHIETVGLLESLWHYTIIAAPYGDIGRKTNREIMASMEWEGDADAVIEALTEVHWIDPHPDPDVRLVVHEWHVHCPEFLKKRVLRSRGEHKFFSEDLSGRGRTCPDVARHVRTGPDLSGPVPVNLTKPNLTKPNLSLNTSARSFPGKPDPKPSKPSKPIDDSPTVLTFQTNGEIREWRLTEAKVKEYQEAFPGLDVLAECRSALQWTKDNPGRRKTAAGMPRFLGSWLTRANDSGKRQPASGPPAPPRPPYYPKEAQ